MDSAENARFVLSQTKWPFLNCVATSENSGIQVFHVLIMWTRRYASFVLACELQMYLRFLLAGVTRN